jgi:hypothetical protein
MDNSLLPPAIITICLDSQSLSDMVRYAWDAPPADGLPLSLARRLAWTSDRPTHVPPAREDQLDPPHADIMDAGSPEDAIELLRVLRFDLAVLGEERLGDAVPAVLKEIKLISPATRCIVVTSTVDAARERAIREAGVLAVLDAPLAFSQLRDVVGHVAAAR